MYSSGMSVCGWRWSCDFLLFCFLLSMSSVNEYRRGVDNKPDEEVLQGRQWMSKTKWMKMKNRDVSG